MDGHGLSTYIFRCLIPLVLITQQRIASKAADINFVSTALEQWTGNIPMETCPEGPWYIAWDYVPVQDALPQA